MATITFTGDNIVNWYGNNVLNDCVKFGVSSVATQILGLVPCAIESLECTKDCFTVPAFGGDFNSFLFEFSPTVLNADFRLFKQDANSTFVQVAILSALEGTKFDIGTIANYPNYGGYLIDWQKVFNLYGKGTYEFQVYNSTTPADSLKSYPFILDADDCNLKDGTSVLEVTNIGLYNNWKYTKDNDQESLFDLQNLEWFDSCRYYGKVVNTELEQNIEEIKYSNSRNEIFYNEGFQNYDFNIFKCDYELFKRINHYLKGKDIKLTNDNLDREYTLIKQNIVLTGESSSQKFAKNPLLYQVNIKMKDEFSDRYKVCE
jgi:hypothetical protein